MVFRTRMMARLALTGLCLWTLAGYSRCVFISTSGGGGYNGNNGGSPDLGIGNSDFTTTLILRDSTGATSSSFVMGESIRFDLEITNNINNTTTLTLPSSQIYDFYVLDAAATNVRWRWSEGMAFAQVVTPLTFSPYASKSYSVVWNGVVRNGTQLPAGSYRARGVIVATNFLNDPLQSSQLGSNIVNFTVR